jgi:hypothetical protein
MPTTIDSGETLNEVHWVKPPNEFAKDGEVTKGHYVHPEADENTKTLCNQPIPEVTEGKVTAVNFGDLGPKGLCGNCKMYAGKR